MRLSRGVKMSQFAQNEYSRKKYGRTALSSCGALGALILALAGGTAVAGEAEAPAGPVTFAVDYKADVVGVVSGGADRGSRFADLLDISADIDLEQAVGWRGGAFHADIQNTSGQAPNDLAGTLQGTDNAEVGARRLRLFQLWVEQGFAGGRGSLRVGLSDLNSEFDAADAAGLLMAPSFGIGPEFAASGPGGPSIFPSTALGARLRFAPTENSYVQGAVINAVAGVPGDRGGMDTDFDEGVLYVAEAGWTGRGKLAAGVWRYSDRRDDIRDTDLLGDPVQRTAQGVYVIAEQPFEIGGLKAGGFFKAGLSDGRTTDFSGGWQAGVLVQPVFSGRENSMVSVGVAQARVSRRARDVAALGGVDLAPAETQFEITYSDELCPHVAIQPDVQWIRRPGADRAQKDAVVVSLRVSIGF